MISMKRKSINQKGIALLTVLIFSAVLVTFVVALLAMTSNDIKLSTIQRDSTKAFYIAESGIEKSLWYLNTSILNGGKGFDWRADKTDPLHEGTPSDSEYYDVTVITIQEETPVLLEIIKINSMGVIKPVGVKNSCKREVEVKAKKGILPSDNLSYLYAVATESNLELGGNLDIVGNIHSNGDISKVAGEAYDLKGVATAFGENPIGASGIYDPLPTIDFNLYRELSKDFMYEGEFYDIGGATKYFDTDEVITGIHFIVGDVVIKSNLTIIGGAIFATGTIISLGNAVINHVRRTENIHLGCEDCCLDPNDSCYDPLCNNPLALVAKGNITLGGTVNTQGIIQTNGKFTSNGAVTVDPGAIVADDGIFRGGGGSMNVVYDESLTTTSIPGTGLPYFIRISWREK
ncbi:hypothetical protein ES708_05299 [subsurface metagenome]